MMKIYKMTPNSKPCGKNSGETKYPRSKHTSQSPNKTLRPPVITSKTVLLLLEDLLIVLIGIDL